eukprot:8747106-Heterocapsa_arctica.AAC.1
MAAQKKNLEEAAKVGNHSGTLYYYPPDDGNADQGDTNSLPQSAARMEELRKLKSIDHANAASRDHRYG